MQLIFNFSHVQVLQCKQQHYSLTGSL